MGVVGHKIIQGNTTGSISTIPLNIACKIDSFFLTPRVNCVLNLYIATTTGDRSAIPVDLAKISGTIYVPDAGQLPIYLDKDQYLILVTSGSVDYWFNISDV